MYTTENVIITLEDLAPGTVLASGHVVESVESGTFRTGDSVYVNFTNGQTGHGGKRNRIWVRAGSVVIPSDGRLF